MHRRILQTLHYRYLTRKMTASQLAHLRQYALASPGNDPLRRYPISAALRLFHSPESRLVTLAGVIAFLIAALAPLLANQPYTPFHLARILLAPLISSIAILAVPRRRAISARILRLSNLLILGAAASIPLGSALLPRSPALAVLYITSGAALLTTIALTTSYLALHLIHQPVRLRFE